MSFSAKKRNITLLVISILAFCAPLFAPCSYALDTHIAITNFTSGELSPLMEGRTDMAKYQSGCIELENFFVYPHGPATKRPGFAHVAKVKNYDKKCRLIPFEFSTEQAYIIEAGEEYMRFYMNQGQILSGDPWSSNAVSNGDFGAGVTDWTLVRGYASSVAGGVTGHCLALNGTGGGQWGVVEQSDIPIEEGEKHQFHWAVKAGSGVSNAPPYYIEVTLWVGLDRIYESGLSSPPAAWTEHTFDFYANASTAEITLEVKGGGGSGVTHYFDEIEIKQADPAYEIETPYQEGDLDDLKWCQSADVMYLTHPDYDVYILERSGHTNFALTSISGASAFTADPFTGADDYPSCCTFHENRLIFANTNTEPNTVWISKSGDFTDFTTGVLDDDAIIITLASDQVNAIQWLVPSIYLTMGTTAGEWRISATDPDDPITPTNITAKRELVYGSYNRMAANIGKDILFIQSARRKIRKLSYNWESAGYVAPDMTVLAEHITESGVSELAFQQEPFSVLWATRADGNLLGLTYLPEHEVFAWHRHTTQGSFESAAVIPGNMQDDLYVVVKRIINGDEKRFIEVLNPHFTGTDLADAILLDGSLSYSGSPVTALTGATIYGDSGVSVLADGGVTSAAVDADGNFSILEAASKVHIGLPYTATLKTMRLEAPAEDGGTSQGRIKRISKAILRLYKTKNFAVGPNEDKLLDVVTESGTTNLFTGDKEISYPGGYEKEGYITVVQDEPLPLTIRSIVVKVTTED